MEKKDSIKITSIVDIFLNYVETDLTAGNLAWFAKEFYKADSENINFYTLPGNYGDSVKQGSQWVSYVTIYVDEWLEIINAHLNPFYDDITAGELNILTRDADGNLHTTSGVREGSSSWGSGRSSSSSSTETPDATATPDVTETPDITETPDVSESPDVSETPDITETPDVTDDPPATAPPDAEPGPTEPDVAAT